MSSHKIFVGNLAYGTREGDVKQFFSGRMKSISFSSNGGSCRIEFKDRADLEAAMAKSGEKLNDRAVKVIEDNGDLQTLFVAGFKKGTTEEVVKALLDPKDKEIETVTMSSGDRIAFVKFKKSSSAFKALKKFDGHELEEGKTLKVDVCVSQRRDPSLKRQPRPRKKVRAVKEQTTDEDPENPVFTERVIKPDPPVKNERDNVKQSMKDKQKASKRMAKKPKNK